MFWYCIIVATSLCSATYVYTTVITWQHSHAAAAAIDRYRSEVATGLLLWAHAETDGRTPYRLIDPAVHTMRVVPINESDIRGG